MSLKVLHIGWLLSAFLCCSLQVQGQTSARQVRQKLVVALNNKRLTDSLYQSFLNVNNRSAQQNAYLAATEALKAKQVWSPFSKISYVSDAEKHLDTAVEQNTHHLEVRFIRFSIEHNVPSFLGYSKHLNTDRQELVKLIDGKHYPSSDRDLAVTVIKFLLDSGRCTAAETVDLRKNLAALK
ncbi:hypothetical protein GCM10027037_18100 [Mucilaginibacter koreensis]